MTGSVTLDVIIGLVFVFLLYSLLATILQEILANKLSFRAKVLEKAILRMLEDGKSTTNSRGLDRFFAYFHLFTKKNFLEGKSIAPWFYAHPLIKYLGEDNFYSKPGYISAENFSKVMLDLLHGIDGSSQLNVLKLQQSIQNGTINTMPVNTMDDLNHPAVSAIVAQANPGVTSGDVKKLSVTQPAKISTPPPATININQDTQLFLKSLWQETSGDLEKFKTKLEQWFNDTMERTSGWYKRYVQFILFVLGLLIAIAFNVDTIAIAKKLARDPKLREQVVQSADNFLKQNQQLAAQLQQMRDKKQDTDPAGKAIYDKTKETYDSVSKRSNELTDSAKNLINTDIKNVNDLLGLGWHDNKHREVKFLCLIPVNTHGFLCWRCNGMHGTGPVLGWLLTALAISLGAPFWFDMLNKLMRLRAGVKADDATNNNTAKTTTPAATPVAITVNTSNPGGDAVG